MLGSVSANVPQARDGTEAEYFEEQEGAWCGMHALNNYLGGPYVNKNGCLDAVRQVCARLSQEAGERGGGDREDEAQHLDPASGWLSIDVINVLGASNLGLHVEGDEVGLSTFFQEGASGALVNFNGAHWTCLRQLSSKGPWIHTNSILGVSSFHGRRQYKDRASILRLLADVQTQYGGVSLHRITSADALTGVQYLESAGVRAMLPREAPVVAADGAGMSDALVGAGETEVLERFATGQTILVTVNVDGLGEYGRSPAQRMAAILDHLLQASPDVMHFQEVVDEMHDVIRRTCSVMGWRVYRRGDRDMPYFLVTAVRTPGGGEDRCASFAFPRSSSGRHVLVVRRGDWVFVNVHLESGGQVVERDERAAQFLHVSRLHESEAFRCYVLAGDFNARGGEDHCLFLEGWADCWHGGGGQSEGEEWTWKKGRQGARYDRAYFRAPSMGRSGGQRWQVARLTQVWDDGLTDHVAVKLHLHSEAAGREPNGGCLAQSSEGVSAREAGGRSSAPRSSGHADHAAHKALRIEAWRDVARARPQTHWRAALYAPHRVPLSLRWFFRSHVEHRAVSTFIGLQYLSLDDYVARLPNHRCRWAAQRKAVAAAIRFPSLGSLDCAATSQL